MLRRAECGCAAVTAAMDVLSMTCRAACVRLYLLDAHGSHHVTAVPLVVTGKQETILLSLMHRSTHEYNCVVDQLVLISLPPAPSSYDLLFRGLSV